MELEESNSSNNLVKHVIWVYFWLLIFEGALRKWVLPGLSDPILIIRDPLAIIIIFIARNRGLLPLNGYVIGMSMVGVLSMFTSMISGHGNFVVSLYGIRPYLFHFPLIFIIGNVFDSSDVIRMGKTILVVSIPMVILIGFQFYSPQSAWINRGVGGDINGGGFSGALGYFRPPGTFSFTTGNMQFFSLVGVFVCYFWFEKKGVNFVLLILSTASLMASIPLSISRSLFAQVSITLIFGLLCGVRKPKQILRIVIAVCSVLIIYLLVNNTDVFKTATDALTDRFETASKGSDGEEVTLVDRFIDHLFLPFYNITNWPLFGYGLGFGTNFASKLLRGYHDFTLGEDDWDRILGEVGPLLGLTIIIIRIGLTTELLFKGFKQLSANKFLSFLLLSFGSLLIFNGNWAQPTSLGFAILSGGLAMAALRDNDYDSQ